MKQLVESDGKTYILDIEEALRAGVLRENITVFNVGDVFRAKEMFPIVIVQAVYSDVGDHKYAFLGQDGLSAYSNYKKVYTRSEAVAHLNNGGYRLIGNINQVVYKAIFALA